MLSEDNVVLHMNDVHRVIRVIFFQELKDFQFDSSLIVVFLFVLDHFESYKLLPLVIEAFYCYAE